MDLIKHTWHVTDQSLLISQSLLYFHCIHLGLHLNHLGFADISVQTKWNECGFFIKFEFNNQIHETEIVMSHDVKCNDAFRPKFHIHMFISIFISITRNRWNLPRNRMCESNDGIVTVYSQCQLTISNFTWFLSKKQWTNMKVK